MQAVINAALERRKLRIKTTTVAGTTISRDANPDRPDKPEGTLDQEPPRHLCELVDGAGKVVAAGEGMDPDGALTAAFMQLGDQELQKRSRGRSVTSRVRVDVLEDVTGKVIATGEADTEEMAYLRACEAFAVNT